MNYEHATDCKGQVIHPGDRVSIKRYPRGTVRGVVAISDRATSILNGVEAPALIVVSDEGTRYNLPGSKSVRKLKR